MKACRRRPSAGTGHRQRVKRLYTGASHHHIVPPPPTKVYMGAFNQYPCLMTIADLSTNAVTLVPGVYITSARDCGLGTIRKTLHDVHDNFLDTLKLCGSRKQIISSYGYTGYITFCHWASSLYNGKLVSAFYQMARDTLTITISDDNIKYVASNLKAHAAQKLLDIMACVTLACDLVSPTGPLGAVEVTTMDIDRFSVSLTIQLSPSYIEGVRMDEERLNSMYGYIITEFQ